MHRTLSLRLVTILLMTLSLVLPFGAPGRALAQDGGLRDDGSYVSPQFGYTVTWGDDWTARARDVISNPGGYDTLTLRSDLGTLWIQGQGDSESAASAVERRISIEGSPADVVSEQLDGEVPAVEMLVGRNKVLIEGYTLDGIDAVVVIVLSARERNFDDALASVHEQVRFNDDTILSGVTIDETDDGQPTDLTTQEPVTATTEAETPEPTGEPTEAATEAPTEAVETPAKTPTEVIASSIEGGVFTSQLYDYAFTFDEDVWTVDQELASDVTDGAVLFADTGTLTIWSWDAYGADAEACLAGENDYYSNEDASVSNWRLARDANGDPIEGSGEGYAWGVFTLTYTNESGQASDLVDYIECRAIPGDDAVVIAFATTSPDLYPDHLGNVLDVIDTIEIEGKRLVEEPAQTPEPQETPTEQSRRTDEPTEQTTPETGLSGSLFTSPTYGFTIDIPSQWRIVDEDLSGGDERLELSNGISEVTIWATDAYQEGDLAGCVDFAAEASNLDLEIDVNANGEPFRKEGRMEAYANFVYTDDNGDKMLHFISCRHIVEGESVLIISQDVPYNEFANQRKYRADLEDAITIPGQ